MTRQINYAFEELPLLVTGGFSAGLVNGQALIDYWTDGQWGVAEIYLDGHKRKPTAEFMQACRDAQDHGRPFPRGYEEKLIPLDRGTPLHAMIMDRLEQEWRANVQDAVNNAIEAAREVADA